MEAAGQTAKNHNVPNGVSYRYCTCAEDWEESLSVMLIEA